jgi:hypothetical protein
MKKSSVTTLALCAVIGMMAIYGVTRTSAVAEAPKEEKVAGLPEAPAWTLKDIHGKEHSLADFRGKYVVMEWVNYGCPFVVKFYRPGVMQQWQKEYTEKGIVWLQICSSNVGKQGYYTPEQWVKENESRNVTVPTLLDTNGVVGKAYGARTTPEFAIINPDGKLIYQGAVDSIRSTNSDDIEKATNYVKIILDAALLTRTQPYGCTIKY